MLNCKSSITVAIAITALVATIASGQPTTSRQALGEIVSVTELLPQTPAERTLEIENDLKVEMLERADGSVQLRATARFENGHAAMIEVKPDFEQRAYTARMTDVPHDALEMLGLVSPAERRIQGPPQKIFGVSACMRAEVLTRSHSGSANVIRSTTATHAEWWFSDLHGFTCIDLYNKGASCSPAAGMSMSTCTHSGSDDGSSRATITSGGGYFGLPAGTSLAIVDATTIRIQRTGGVVAALNSADPVSEPLTLQVIYTSYEVSCPFSV